MPEFAVFTPVLAVSYCYFITQLKSKMEYKDTKLIVFLKTFSKNEINEFEKFLDSPYFKKGRDPLQLLRVLKKFHPEFLQKEFSEGAVLKELYSGEDKQDKNAMNTLRSLSSYLLKAVEEFLYISEVKKSSSLKNRTLLKEILDRNLLRNYPQYLKTANEDLIEHESFTGLDYLEKYHLEKLNSRYSFTVMELQNYFSHASDSVKYLSVHFLIDLLASAKARILGKDNENMVLENSFIEDLLGKLDLESILPLYNGASNEFHLHFHYNVYKFLKSGGDREFFEKAREAFLKNRSRINRYDLVYYYSDLINMFHTRFITANVETKSELLSLIKSCLDDRAYKISDDDYMHPLFYRNVILCADYLQECDWAYEFIDKFTGELRPELRDNLALYSRALIDYRKGNYEESLVNISKVKYDLVAFKTDVKTLMLRIFYELKLEDQAMATADTVRHYVKTAKEIDDHYKQAYRNFLIYYLKLFKLNSSTAKNKSAEAKLLLKQMNEEKLLLQRKWLLEKISALQS